MRLAINRGVDRERALEVMGIGIWPHSPEKTGMSGSERGPWACLWATLWISSLLALQRSAQQGAPLTPSGGIPCLVGGLTSPLQSSSHARSTHQSQQQTMSPKTLPNAHSLGSPMGARENPYRGYVLCWGLLPQPFCSAEHPTLPMAPLVAHQTPKALLKYNLSGYPPWHMTSLLWQQVLSFILATAHLRDLKQNAHKASLPMENGSNNNSQGLWQPWDPHSIPEKGHL